MPKPKQAEAPRATAAASKGGFVLPKATRRNYKPPKPRKPKTKAENVCGAKKRKGGTCNMAAGWGTEHPGYGACKLHAGLTPSHVKAAAKEEYRILLGKPVNINPLEALIMCIKIRAGEVQWLSNRMQELDEKSWVEDTMVGKQFHLYARERQHAMNDLARYSQMAISLNISERAVKLAESYGETLAMYTKNLLEELWPHLSEEGRAAAPQIVRRQLIALDGGRQSGDHIAELPAASAA